MLAEYREAKLVINPDSNASMKTQLLFIRRVEIIQCVCLHWTPDSAATQQGWYSFIQSLLHTATFTVWSTSLFFHINVDGK